MNKLSLPFTLVALALFAQGCVVRTNGQARTRTTNASEQPKSVATHDVQPAQPEPATEPEPEALPQPEVEEVIDVKDERPFVQIQGKLANGEPQDFAARAETAYWIWRDADSGQWFVRTTSAESSHVFRGRIGAPGGTLGMVQPARAEGKDRYLVKENGVHFAFRTGPQTDGLNIAPATGTNCVRFKFLVDGEPAPNIYVGQALHKPASHRFKVCD